MKRSVAFDLLFNVMEGSQLTAIRHGQFGNDAVKKTWNMSTGCFSNLSDRVILNYQLNST